MHLLVFPFFLGLALHDRLVAAPRRKAAFRAQIDELNDSLQRQADESHDWIPTAAPC
jgi:hypothetical protein